MYKKVSKEIIMILVTAAFLTVQSSVLQVSHAQSNTNLQNTVLNMHNQERAAVGVQPLVWSNSLATEAQGYANQLASQGYVCTFEDCKTILPHGATNENLAWGSVGYPLQQHIQGWINEKSYMGGHYTAMVWQNTREVGCGTAAGAQIDILVCRYNPPGNIAGQTPFGTGAAQAVGEEDAGFPPTDQAVGEEDAGFPPADQAVGEEDAGFPPADQAVGDDGGGGGGDGDEGGDEN